LQEDSRFFQEYHYLNPFGVDDSEPPAPWVWCIVIVLREYFFPWVVTSREILVLKMFRLFWRLPRLDM
jgi:hypothetical protein